MCGVAPTEGGYVGEETGPPPRRPGPQGRRARTSLSSGASSLPPVWFLNSFSAGIRAEAPGRRSCCPTHSPSAPPKLKARHPIPASDRSAEGPGPSTEPQSLRRPKPDFHRWKLRPREKQSPLPGSHEEGAPPGPDAGPPDPS